jgi:hypothetical protein
VYVPNKDFTGYDYITYNVSDGKAASLTPATVAIHVVNVEDPPVAKPFAYEMPKNTSTGIRLIATDPDPGDSLIYHVLTPHHGALTPTGSEPNEFMYQPAHGFAGPDSFLFRVSDGVDSAEALISVSVLNQRPGTRDTLIAQPAGTAFNVLLFGTDADGDSLSYAVLRSPSHGALNTDSLPKIVYQPKPGYGGRDTLTYTAFDGIASDTGQVEFVVMVPTSVPGSKPLLPATFELYQNYPNPFNPATKIEYDIPRAADVTLKIYNVLGQEVAVLADGPQQPGRKVAIFNASHVATGVYFYRIVAASKNAEGKPDVFTRVRKMLLIK